MLKRIVTSDRNLQLIQDNVDSALIPLQSQAQTVGDSPFQGGAYLQNQALVNGSTSITHGLGRVPVIWVIGDVNAAATIYRATWDNQTIVLNSNAACIISIWVN